ncbi:unnamed protein product [Nesidiocoris tenuis]|uniref:C2H2-type domain-containing protein n=1 Tax=Nesidiocoris tenuis TaxID=355587 RepID=A0A6H5H0R8_9HEMI|nr:unnamed protein product [Nesidiocoris tenuis]
MENGNEDEEDRRSFHSDEPLAKRICKQEEEARSQAGDDEDHRSHRTSASPAPSPANSLRPPSRDHLASPSSPASSDRSGTPRSTTTEKKSTGSLGALSSMFDNLSGSTAGGAGEPGASSGNKASHPLAALQKLCDKTETHTPRSTPSSLHQSNNPSTSTTMAPTGGTAPGAILAFSWACNDAVVTADSIMKCAFCDTPFISKGAYRHHLSKMHFVKDGVIPDPVGVKAPSNSPNSANSSSSAPKSTNGNNHGPSTSGSSKSPQPPPAAMEESPHSKFLKYTELARQLSSKYKNSEIKISDSKMASFMYTLCILNTYREDRSFCGDSNEWKTIFVALVVFDKLQCLWRLEIKQKPGSRSHDHHSYNHDDRSATATVPMAPYETTLNFHDISNVHVQVRNWRYEVSPLRRRNAYLLLGARIVSAEGGAAPGAIPRPPIGNGRSEIKSTLARYPPSNGPEARLREGPKAFAPPETPFICGQPLERFDCWTESPREADNNLMEMSYRLMVRIFQNLFWKVLEVSSRTIQRKKSARLAKKPSLPHCPACCQTLQKGVRGNHKKGSTRNRPTARPQSRLIVRHSAASAGQPSRCVLHQGSPRLDTLTDGSNRQEIQLSNLSRVGRDHLGCGRFFSNPGIIEIYTINQYNLLVSLLPIITQPIRPVSCWEDLPHLLRRAPACAKDTSDAPCQPQSSRGPLPKVSRRQEGSEVRIDQVHHGGEGFAFESALNPGTNWMDNVRTDRFFRNVT